MALGAGGPMGLMWEVQRSSRELVGFDGLKA